MKAFSDNIRYLRKEKGITQGELAKALNVRNTTVSAWETAVSEPNIDTLIELCKFFEVSLASLVGVDTEINPTTKLDVAHQLQISDKDRELIKKLHRLPNTLQIQAYAYIEGYVSAIKDRYHLSDEEGD